MRGTGESFSSHYSPVTHTPTTTTNLTYQRPSCFLVAHAVNSRLSLKWTVSHRNHERKLRLVVEGGRGRRVRVDGRECWTAFLLFTGDVVLLMVRLQWKELKRETNQLITQIYLCKPPTVKPYHNSTTDNPFTTPTFQTLSTKSTDLANENKGIKGRVFH